MTCPIVTLATRGASAETPKQVTPAMGFGRTERGPGPTHCLGSCKLAHVGRRCLNCRLAHESASGSGRSGGGLIESGVASPPIDLRRPAIYTSTLAWKTRPDRLLSTSDIRSGRL